MDRDANKCIFLLLLHEQEEEGDGLHRWCIELIDTHFDKNVSPTAALLCVIMSHVHETN